MRCEKQRAPGVTLCADHRKVVLNQTMARYWSARAAAPKRKCKEPHCGEAASSRNWCAEHLALLQRAAERLYPQASNSLESIQVRSNRLKKTYGITLAEYEQMWIQQGGTCAVCGQFETTLRCGRPVLLAVDHCHETGEVRGLLCNNCNRAIGMLGDNPAVLASAVEYLLAAGGGE